jgi:hypothetical protein
MATSWEHVKNACRAAASCALQFFGIGRLEVKMTQISLEGFPLVDSAPALHNGCTVTKSVQTGTQRTNQDTA